MRRVWKQMCSDGWAGVGWPEEWGGQGFSAIEQFVFFDESMRAGRAGADAHDQHRRADDHALRHRRAEGSSSCRRSSAARSTSRSATRSPAPAPTSRRSRPARCATATSTSSTARRCGRRSRATPTSCGWRCAPTRRSRSTRGSRSSRCRSTRPGITISPLTLLPDHDINQVFFDDVRVPVTSVRRGREQRLDAHHQPAQPRAGHALRERWVPSAPSTRCVTWAQETTLADGRRVIDQEWVQLNLARVAANLEVLRLMNWQVAWEQTQGVLDIGHCSAVKVYGTERNLDAWRAPHGGARPGRRTSRPTRPARCCARGSRACTAAPSSSRSAAAPTSRSAT